MVTDQIPHSPLGSGLFGVPLGGVEHGKVIILCVMPRNRGFAMRGRPSQLFKKRYIYFSTLVANTTPTTLAKFDIEETSTVYAVKIQLAGRSLEDAGTAIQEVTIGVFCRKGHAPGAVYVPDLSTVPENSTYEGFSVGSIWCQGNVAATGTIFQIAEVSTIREKFRFRRKCDKDTSVILFADSIVRAGTAASVQVFGTFELIIRVK